MLVGWLALASACGAPVALSPRITLLMLAMALVAVFVTPYAYLAHDIASVEHRKLLTWAMRLGGGVAIAPISLAVVVALARKPMAALQRRGPAAPLRAALLSSVLISQLNAELALLPNAAGLGTEPGLHVIRGGSAALDPVPAAQLDAATQGVVRAFDWTFLICALFAFTNLCLALFLRELPLKTTSGREREDTGGD